MPRLSLSLLGPFQAKLDDEVLSGFTSPKTRGLLAYLAVESGRAHRRESLAALLWPEHPPRAALGNLRYALLDLRRVLGRPPGDETFLLIRHDSLQFNPASDHCLDVSEFLGLLSGPESERSGRERLERATSLYRGPFLEDLSPREAEAFEEWALLRREEYTRRMLAALRELAAVHEEAGDYRQAESCLRRSLEMEPWDEEVHRQLMRLLALSGRRAAALAQFEACRRLLARELDVEPSQETTALYEAIRNEKLRTEREAVSDQPSAISRQPSAATHHPSLITHHSSRSSVLSPQSFVGRERELAQLEGHLRGTLDGSGRAVFVVGEAGSGKTALLWQFARESWRAHPDLVVAEGHCNAHTGPGDPYLPFRQILQLLCGDPSAAQASAFLGRDGGRRPRGLLPGVLRALVEEGPDLIGLLAPADRLAAQLEALGSNRGLGVPQWRTRLEGLLQRQAAGPPGPDRRQADIFQQFTRVVHAIARGNPLLLLLDDLQWADPGSLGLLFHLGRNLAGSRLLVLGTYRSDEVAAGRDGKRHPLEAVANELRRVSGLAAVDLAEAEGRSFVNALLDAEPNRLDAEFRDRMFRHTGGHALFTVELLRDLRERGSLVRDEAGRWVEETTLEWDRLPPRVDAAIAERLGRLPAPWRELLAVAAVEGDEFTAEVAARVQGTEEREAVRLLSGPLGREQGLVSPLGARRRSGRRLSRYRFRHHLFQRYLYARLDPVERSGLHESVARELEALYGGHEEGAPLPLARHFEAAGMDARAADCLLQAGDEARRLCAHEAAIGHYRRALRLLEGLPPTAERDRQEMRLQLALGTALVAVESWGAPEQAGPRARAYELSRGLGEEAEMLPALCALASSSRGKGDLEQARRLEEQILRLAEGAGDPARLALADWSLGESLLLRGEPAPARERLEKAVALCDALGLSFVPAVVGTDLGSTCLAWLSQALWLLGYSRQAARRAQEALDRARESHHGGSHAFALMVAGCQLHAAMRDEADLELHRRALADLVERTELRVMRPWVTFLEGRALVARGSFAEGIARMRRGAEVWRDRGSVAGRPNQLQMLAEACWQAGRPEEGLSLVEEGLALAESTGLRLLEADLHRLKGEMLLSRQLSAVSDRQSAVSCQRSAVGNQALALHAEAMGDRGEREDREGMAEACFRQAIEVARRQQARSWELRAATSLARLWIGQGRPEEARAILAPVYGWFTEGFDTPDLVDARALLDAR